MAPTQQLYRETYGGKFPTMIANGALTANLCVAAATGVDTTGGTVRAVAALADKIVGVTDQSYIDAEYVKVQRGADVIVSIVCVDASIATNVPVYNDATGKVSATQGTNATLIGTTKGKTTAANQLVPVALAAF